MTYGDWNITGFFLYQVLYKMEISRETNKVCKHLLLSSLKGAKKIENEAQNVSRKEGALLSRLVSKRDLMLSPVEKVWSPAEFNISLVTQQHIPHTRIWV